MTLVTDPRPSASPLATSAPVGAGRQISLAVEGMTCASCVGRVEKALTALPGTTDVSANLATGRANLRIASWETASAALGAIDRAGYSVTETTTTVGIEGMTCASCVARVEKALTKVPGVVSASVNLATGEATIRHPDGLVARASLEDAIRAAGYDPGRVESKSEVSKADRQEQEAAALRRDVIIAMVLSLPIVILDMGGHQIPAFGHYLHDALGMRGLGLIEGILATAVLAWPGRRFFTRGVPTLLRGHPDMNALVALGAGAAYLYSIVSTLSPDLLPPGTAHLYFEASVLIVTLILVGRSLEARARGRTSAAITHLVGLRPKTARLVRDGSEVDVAIANLKVDDVVRVRPGERIAADGFVIGGNGFVDESMITGEASPIRKEAGSKLVGGTLNGNGSLDLKVGATGADTVLAQIVAMVEAAQGAKLPIQALVDRVTLWFVPAIILAALATFLAWLILGSSPALGLALVNAIAVLIIACPCAMGLATPTSIMVGTGRAAEQGVLFRNGTALQTLRDVRVVAFDKTGTLTLGRPAVTAFQAAPGFAQDEVMALAAGVEARSEHPIGRALVEAAEAKGLALENVEDFASEPGFGVSGRVGGRQVAVGARRYMEKLGVACDTGVAGLANRPLHVALEGRLAATFSVADPVKPGAEAAIADLKSRGVTVAMVTGDDRRTAERVAAALGIAIVEAEVLPAGKVDAVRRLRDARGPIAFVGDGINDAPALAEADIGLAIGTGTDIAVESADVVLMAGDVAGVAKAVALSQTVIRNIRQNLFWAFAYNVALIPVAAGLLHAFGGPLLSPILAAAAMALSSVFVLTNALRLRRA
ncbi:MAG: cadmium-translocating P-type ATPase [Methylobacterium sp.]|uniref:heavy metal translocating P-type ATPase n=1 Tax=Methylobacterium sp. TaxID=409 RepID=UPI0025E9FC67|nr:heavy metal translocating P-type ATPase [Methylobacterium sp.]MBX9933395.1 cadmium-translocating P-type ATPase [Methylobacterium sp.]